MYDFVDWNQDHYGVVSKLIFNQSVVSNTEGLLRSMGMVHLYTASGIHIYALVDAINRLMLRTNQILNKRWFWLKPLGFAIAVLGAILAWCLQDFRLGFARPLLIFFIRLWANKRGARFRILYPLMITLALDFIFQIESGRLHYYLAVGGGLLGLELAKVRKSGILSEHLGMALGSWFLTAILDLVSYHQVIWMTPVWSLITLPLISFVLYPATLISIALFGAIPNLIFSAWNLMLDCCIELIDFGFTFSFVSKEALLFSGAVALLASICFSKLRTHKTRVQFCFCLLSFAVLARVVLPIFNHTNLVQFDVKQGDSMLIQKGDRVEMVDVGSQKSIKPHQWLQKLSKQGVDHVDVILLSHLDEDHSGGLIHLVSCVRIDTIQLHESFVESRKGQDLYKKVQARVSIPWVNENRLRLMKLGYFRTKLRRSDGNGLMAGIVVPFDEHRAYFGLGDGDFTQESQYISYFWAELKHYPFKIWKAGHHGSKYSSGSRELHLIQPNEVWLSVGKRNRYGHPSIEAMSRIASLGGVIRRTDEEGDLRLH